MKGPLFREYVKLLALLRGRGQDSRHDIARYLQLVYVSLAGLIAPGLCLEIGAREATFSRMVRSVVPKETPVLAIEGSPITYRYYAKEMEMFYPEIHYIPLVFSSKSGRQEFFEFYAKEKESLQVKSSAGFSSLIASRKGDLDSFIKISSVVETTTGDNFLSFRYPEKENLALWVDVEGAQAEVLQGLRKSFANRKIASVLIEVESVRYWESQKMLDVNIFAFMEKQGMIPCFLDNQFITQYNVVFVRKDVCERHADGMADLAEKYMACLKNLC